MGCALYAAGRIDQALIAFQESLRIRHEYDNWYATGLTLHNLARALESADRHDEAAHARENAASATARAGATGATGATRGHHH
ncbi:tetratricopeptide repeat protein [Streptomyces avermitilis]|uniref:tetratricopeptide repeat protein n=1 Tax=Streptomyces avermitilis TaxID=33903 RepID=UPI003F4CCB03